MLQVMADDETRFAGVKRLGVDEHMWHHVSELPINRGGRGPEQLTGMLDFTPRDADGTPRTRLLDLVPGRSGKAYGRIATGSRNAARRQTRMAVRPATALRIPRAEHDRRPTHRREGPRVIPDLPDLRNQTARHDPETMVRRIPGLPRNRPRQQRRHRSSL